MDNKVHYFPPESSHKDFAYLFYSSITLHFCKYDLVLCPVYIL